MASPGIQNKVPETHQVVTSVEGPAENFRQLFLGSSMSLKEHFSTLGDLTKR